MERSVTPSTWAFQSTLPIREETYIIASPPAIQSISIHSSHTGRDVTLTAADGTETISIHSSHTGRDTIDGVDLSGDWNFNPLFPYGKRQRPDPSQHLPDISIHSSHTGRDFRPAEKVRIIEDFNPLFPYGKRRPHAARPALPPAFQSTLPIREET